MSFNDLLLELCLRVMVIPPGHCGQYQRPSATTWRFAQPSQDKK